MINLMRRKRQAQKNTGTLILAVLKKVENNALLGEKQTTIHDLSELDGLIAAIEPNASALAQSLHSDWAIPIVLQAIGELYYGAYTQYSYSGNFFKRAVVYLWQNSFEVHGNYKNMARLEDLVFQCYTIEILYSLRKMFLAIPDFWFTFKNGHAAIPNIFRREFQEFGILGSGRGKRLRVAEENSRLMNELSPQFLRSLTRVLEGEAPKDMVVFKNTFYEKIPGIENLECKKFWQEVFCRYCIYLAALVQLEELSTPTDVLLFKEFAVEVDETFLTQDIVENSFWKKRWFKKQNAENYGNLIVAKPIVRISPEGDFATSPVLVGDSLNQFIEEQLLGYSNRDPYLKLPNKIFRDAFSEKFENQCIDLFRDHGYLAGHILETGVWQNQSGNTDLNIPNEKLYGEIDVCAYHPELPIIFLVECKVLLDIRDSRSYQNVASKLKDDSESFKIKLRKKSVWLKKSFMYHYNLSIEPLLLLVTDIPLPILGTDSEDVSVIDFELLRDSLETIY